MEPRITTIIPTYRRPKLLRRAILSVLQQTYRDFEVKVYDNASCDETREVVGNFMASDSRVKYHCHPENIGLVQNFAYGMERVYTPFFNILSDDDLVFPDFFELALSALAKNPDAILFTGATIWATRAGDISDIPVARWREGLYRPPHGLFEIISSGHPDFTGTLFRREIMTTVGTLDPAVGNPFDVDLFCRCAAVCPIVVSTQPCGVLFQHSERASAQAPYAPLAYWPTYGKIAEKIGCLRSLPEEQRRQAYALMMKHTQRNVFLRGCKASADGDTQQAMQAATILRESFSDPWGAFVVRALSACRSLGLGSWLTTTSRAVRLWRMKSRRQRIPADVFSSCSVALYALLNETSADSA
ncbi:MAG: glycosyltransferase family 2 protein [Candidatus Binataceae bacterium]